MPGPVAVLRKGRNKPRRDCRNAHHAAGSAASDTDLGPREELAQHAQLTIDTGVRVYFADPRSPWQHDANENTNGLLRQYFPKGTDLARWSGHDLDTVAATFNNRARMTLGWKTPAEAMNEHLLSLQHAGVATTG